MKAVILDAMRRIVSVADTDVVLGCVQHVAHPGRLEVGEVTDGLPVTDDDPSADLRRTCDNVTCVMSASSGSYLVTVHLPLLLVVLPPP